MFFYQNADFLVEIMDGRDETVIENLIPWFVLQPPGDSVEIVLFLSP